MSPNVPFCKMYGKHYHCKPVGKTTWGLFYLDSREIMLDDGASACITNCQDDYPATKEGQQTGAQHQRSCEMEELTILKTHVILIDYDAGLQPPDPMHPSDFSPWI